MSKFKDYLLLENIEETLPVDITESTKVKGIKALDLVLKNILEARGRLFSILKYVEKNFKIKGEVTISNFNIDSNQVYLHITLPLVPIADYSNAELTKGEQNVKKLGGKWLLTTGDLYIDIKS